jgi:hypothetical protein
MTNITKKTNQQQSLLAEAFAALLEKLGPEKTAQVWQVFIAPYGDYLTIRPTLSNSSKIFRRNAILPRSL